MPEPTLYLFDGYNLLHAGGHTDVRELTDELAELRRREGRARGRRLRRGRRGVRGRAALRPLRTRTRTRCSSVSRQSTATRERVCLVSSDAAVRGTSGQEVRKVSSSTFLRELERPTHVEEEASQLRDRLDPETRAKLERLRRGL